MHDGSALRALRRRWWVLLAGALVTLVAMGWVYAIPGVYFAQTDEIFLAPQSTQFPNTLTSGGGSLIDLAGIVAREVNGQADLRTTSTTGITLVDEGIRQGVQVQLPDTGGQWAHNFAQPLLDVQVVGPTESYVRTNLLAAQAKIRETLDRMQAEAHVDQYNLITIESSPATPDIQYLTGHRKVSVLVTAVLGVALSIALTIFVDRFIDRRRRHRAGSAELETNSDTQVSIDA